MKTATARQLLITLVPSSLILVGMVVVYLVFHISMIDMTLDVTEVIDVHPLVGFLSNLGILLWAATASVCLFAAISVRNFQPRVIFLFLLCSGILSAYLTLDDLFRIHEWLSPKYLHISERVFISELGLLVLVYLYAFRRIFLQTNFSVVILAFVLLGMSVLIDLTPERWTGKPGEWMDLLEDGTKWLGIACWCSYFVRTSHQFFVEAVQSSANSSTMTQASVQRQA
jgi:hypothetical protein